MDQDTIKALIQKYRNQIDFLQGMIRQLETELGQSAASSPESQQGVDDSSRRSKSPAVTVSSRTS